MPIVTQIANHLGRVGGSFSGTELVTVMAGANDLFRFSDTLVANATAAGNGAFLQSFVSQLAAGATDPAAAGAAIMNAIAALPPGSALDTVIVPTAVGTAATQGFWSFDR